MRLTPPGRRRPFFLWVMVLGLLYAALMNSLRLYGALKVWKLLIALQEQPGPLYLALTGAVFALIFTLSAAGLFFRARWGLWAARLVALVYAVWYWVDRLLISDAGERFTGWPFSLGWSIVLLALVFSATSVLSQFWQNRPD